MLVQLKLHTVHVFTYCYKCWHVYSIQNIVVSSSVSMHICIHAHNHTHQAAVAARAERAVERIWAQFGLINVCCQLSWQWVVRQPAVQCHI